MARKAFFVTGTDTNVGKTLVSAALLLAAKQKGLSTAALKPVASGCEETSQGLRNSDAVLLQSVITQKLYYEQINPYALREPIAPHIAALHEKRSLSVDRIAGFCRSVLSSAEFTIVEGAGGWRVPLNSTETLADLAKLLNLPVILVVAVRLGCLNHTLLTLEAMLRDGVQVAGWVANCVDENMLAQNETIQSLAAKIHAPCLGVVPYLSPANPENLLANLSSEALSGLYQ